MGWWARLLLRFSVLGTMVLLVGCGPKLAPGKPEAQLTPVEHAGEGVFQARCSGCHYAHSDQTPAWQRRLSVGAG